MTDLSDSTDSLRRAVAQPGAFATTFPETSDADVVGTLLDAFAEVQMDGFLLPNTGDYVTYTWTDDGIITPDIPNGMRGLVVLYGAVRFLRAVLANRPNITHYQAGSAVYETQTNATILTEILKELTQTKKDAIFQLRLGGVSKAFYMGDQYLARVWSDGYLNRFMYSGDSAYPMYAGGTW